MGADTCLPLTGMQGDLKHEIHVGGTRLQMGLGAKGGREVPGACTSSRYYNY
jgi:hypothetical protein